MRWTAPSRCAPPTSPSTTASTSSERGELGSYGTLDQALTAIGTVENWPVVVEPQLEPAASYEIGVRASIRRGTLSGALRALIWWSSSWQRSSEWYTWSLPR